MSNPLLIATRATRRRSSSYDDLASMALVPTRRSGSGGSDKIVIDSNQFDRLRVAAQAAMGELLETSIDGVLERFATDMDSALPGAAALIRGHFPKEELVRVVTSAADTAALPAYLAGVGHAREEAIEAGRLREEEINRVAMRLTVAITRIEEQEGTIAKLDKATSERLEDHRRIVAAMFHKVIQNASGQGRISEAQVRQDHEIGVQRRNARDINTRVSTLEGEVRELSKTVKKFQEMTFTGQFIRLGKDIATTGVDFTDRTSYQALVLVCLVSVVARQVLKFTRKVPVFGSIAAIPIALIVSQLKVIALLSSGALLYKGVKFTKLNELETIQKNITMIRFYANELRVKARDMGFTPGSGDDGDGEEQRLRMIMATACIFTIGLMIQYRKKILSFTSGRNRQHPILNLL
ncbi:MAG: hypothetical protein L7U87_06650 [Chlamydiales bacterium]|nr:hypothetical protein [Chlamydiales bacterium]